MSIAPRDAKWMMRWSRWFGHSGWVQYVSLSPSTRVSGLAQRARTGLREHPRLGLLRALGQHRLHDLGDHVAGLAHHDLVARAHVLQPHLILVVQRREPHRRSADEHRLEHREGCRLPRATDRHHDVVQRRDLFLGRELVRDGPARRVARATRARRVARGRRSSRRRRRSRTGGSAGAPASRRSTGSTASRPSSVRISGFTGRPSDSSMRNVSW